MSQIYNDIIKRPKLQDTQLEILKIYPFCQKIQQRVSVQEEHCPHYTVYFFENTPQNLMVQGRMQLEGSSHIVKIDLK